MLLRLSILFSLIFTAASVQASQLPDYPFIHAVGNASIYVQPDIGEISFEISVSDADSDKATQQLAAINAEILALIAELHIPASDVEIYELQKKMRISENPDGKPGIVTYDIKQGVQIEVRDLNAWAGLAMPLLSKNNLGNFDTAFDRTDRRKINDDLVAEAAKTAQHNGATMAEAFGRHLGAVVAMSSGKLKDIGFSLGLAPGNGFNEDSHRENAIRNFSAPTAIRIMQSVDVLFKMK